MKTLLLILILPAIILSQELDAKVTVNFEKLPAEYKDRLSSFAQELEEYINNVRYTGDSWDYDKIRCNFNIFFSSASDETHYSAQVNVSSVRGINKSNSSSLMLNVVDNNWEFLYEKGQSMYFNPEFDPIADFLDFYAYIILGLDFDSYSELGGSPYFDAAHKISILAANLGSKYKGWEKGSTSYTKRGLVEDIVSEKYRQFREDYYDYHYNGLDLLAEKRQFAQENIVRLIKNLEVLRTKQDISGILLKTFFDAKSTEIINVLRDYPDKSIFASLKKVDPPHIAKYDEAMSAE